MNPDSSTSSASDRRGTKLFWQIALPVFLLLLVTAVLYRPAAGFDFLTYDDQRFIVNDPVIQQLDWESLKTIFLEPYAFTWYPVARLSAALDILVFGHDASGHHLVSVALHFLNAAALFLVLTLIGQRLLVARPATMSPVLPALLVSVLFAVHPQHVEAVSWLVQRKELLASLFSLIAIAVYLTGRPVLSTFILGVAMLSKPTAIMVPVLLLLLGFAMVEPGERRFAGLAKLALGLSGAFLLSVCVALLVLINTDKVVGMNEAFPLLTRVVLYANNAMHGISGFVTLRAGSFHQPIPSYVTSGSWLGGLSVVLLALLLLIAAGLLASRQLSVRVAATGFLFYIAALLPTGGIKLFGNYAFGDRYLYLSSIGLYLALFVVVLQLMCRYRATAARHAITALVVLWLCAAFLLSSKALPRWTNTWTLWADNVERHPDSVLVNYSLGHYYMEKGDLVRALGHFAVTMRSESETFRIEPRVGSALFSAEIYCSLDQGEAAIDVLEIIPEVGGDLSQVDNLMSSLKFSGYDACHEVVRRWRNSAVEQPRGGT